MNLDVEVSRFVQVKTLATCGLVLRGAVIQAMKKLVPEASDLIDGQIYFEYMDIASVGLARKIVRAFKSMWTVVSRFRKGNLKLLFYNVANLANCHTLMTVERENKSIKSGSILAEAINHAREVSLCMMDLVIEFPVAIIDFLFMLERSTCMQYKSAQDSNLRGQELDKNLAGAPGPGKTDKGKDKGRLDKGMLIANHGYSSDDDNVDIDALDFNLGHQQGAIPSYQGQNTLGKKRKHNEATDPRPGDSEADPNALKSPTALAEESSESEDEPSRPAKGLGRKKRLTAPPQESSDSEGEPSRLRKGLNRNKLLKAPAQDSSDSEGEPTRLAKGLNRKKLSKAPAQDTSESEGEPTRPAEARRGAVSAEEKAQDESGGEEEPARHSKARRLSKFPPARVEENAESEGEQDAVEEADHSALMTAKMPLDSPVESPSGSASLEAPVKASVYPAKSKARRILDLSDDESS